MKTFFTTAMIIAMLAVAASFTLGILVMARGGEFNQKYGNKLMRLRVFLQGIALTLFAAAFFSTQNGE